MKTYVLFFGMLLQLHYCIGVPSHSPLKPVDSLKAVLSNAKLEEESRIKVLSELATAEKVNDYTEAKMFAREALSIAITLEQKPLIAKTYLLLAEIELENSNLDSLIYDYDLALQCLDHEKDKLIIADVLNKKGIAYEQKGNYTKSYQAYLLSLKLYEAMHDKKGVCNEYLNIGLIHQYQREYLQAEKYFSQALSLAKEISYEGGISAALNNFGMVCLEQQNFKDALIYFKQVLARDLREGNKQNIASSFNNIGTVCEEQNKYAEALVYFYKSAALKEELQDQIGLANTYNNISEVQMKLGNLVDAEEYLNKSLTLGLKYGFQQTLAETYRSFYELALIKKDFPKALLYFKKYESIEDSLVNKESELAIKELAGRYELDKTNAELDLKNAALANDAKLRLLYIIVIVLLVGLLVFLYLNIRRTRRLLRTLEHQHHDLVKAKDIAENATKIKSQFLSVISHEIRTPLNAIIGVANLLDSNMDVELQQANLSVMKSASNNLLHLINDLLDLNKLELGKMHLEADHLILKKVVNGIQNMFQLLAAQKGIELKLLFDKRIPQSLVGDEIKLTQAITNLVGNAVKFTEKGFVQMQVSLVGTSDTMVHVSFSVTDTGIGIAANKQQTIFETFTQANFDTNRKYGGTGLGLSISQKLVEMMGGKLEVSSELNKGSEFAFTLPFYLEKPDYGKPLIQKVNGTKLFYGKQVLVADDNHANIFVLKQFLERWGAIVTEVENGEDAIRQIKSQSFDMVLMDFHMPIKDGVEATLEIRNAGEKWSNIPIIAITASSEESVIESIRKSGMNDFIIKPFIPDELIQKLNKYL